MSRHSESFAYVTLFEPVDKTGSALVSDAVDLGRFNSFTAYLNFGAITGDSVLTVYSDDARIFAALCAGACGYLLKKTPPARLLEALREAVDGGSPMSPEVARSVIGLFRDIRPPQNADYELTPHETRLLKMMVEGHNYKSAAKEFGVTTHAVSFHMRRIYEKLQVHSKSEAVAKALKNRLV